MRYLTAGDSHGKALNAIVKGFPSGVNIDKRFIDDELRRRQGGYGRGKRMSIESDNAEIISGVRKGISTGSPISLIIKNDDWDNWKDRIDTEEDILNPRPGHADLVGFLKYRLSSIRDVIERSSARETAARVSVGALCKMALKHFDVNIISFVASIGNVRLDVPDKVFIEGKPYEDPEKSELRCPDVKITLKMIEEIDRSIDEGESIGGDFYVICNGVIPGIGSYESIDTRLDARLAQAMISIPAIKSFEVGLGVESSRYLGTEYHDEIFYSEKKGFFRKTNRAGGIEGGMSNGMPIVIKAAMKPIPTTVKGLRSIDIKAKTESISLKERSDYCAVPAASIVGEAMAAIVLLEMYQEKFGQDNIKEMVENYLSYKSYLKKI